MQSFNFIRGLAIGFALAAPVGPVGILCIRRALADGRYAAFIAGVGAAFADTFYGAVAGLGITVVSGFLLEHAFALRLVGGAFLLLLGGRTWVTPPTLAPDPGKGPGLVRDFFSTFLITLSNPGTILASMGVFAAVAVIVVKVSALASLARPGAALGLIVGLSAARLLPALDVRFFAYARREGTGAAFAGAGTTNGPVVAAAAIAANTMARKCGSSHRMSCCTTACLRNRS